MEEIKNLQLNLKQERSMDGGCQEDAIENANAERNIEGNSSCTRTKVESSQVISDKNYFVQSVPYSLVTNRCFIYMFQLCIVGKWLI